VAGVKEPRLRVDAEPPAPPRQTARQIGVLRVAAPEDRVEATGLVERGAPDEERKPEQLVRAHVPAGLPDIAREVVAGEHVAGGIQRGQS
jgi:hypothetical protein